MIYALLDENNIITNVIVLNPENAADFPNAVPTYDVQTNIGDEYRNGYFYHEGERCYSVREEMEIALRILTMGVTGDE